MQRTLNEEKGVEQQPPQGGECRCRKSRREFIHVFYDRAFYLLGYDACSNKRAVIEPVNKLTKCVNQANSPLLTEEGWLRQ